jgi:hypothetical protein
MVQHLQVVAINVLLFLNNDFIPIIIHTNSMDHTTYEKSADERIPEIG